MSGSLLGKPSYIQDGLVFWLDGADALGEGNSATKWTDRIAGIEFDLVNCSKDNNGGVVFNTYANSYGVSGSSFIISPSIVTIEVVFNVSQWNRVNVLFDFGYNSISWYISKERAIVIPHNNSVKYPIHNVYNMDNNKTITVSLNANEAYSNKSMLAAYIGKGITGATRPATYLGAFMNNKINLWFAGTIKQIRVYNRILSSAEMRHNQDIDNKLYHLF